MKSKVLCLAVLLTVILTMAVSLVSATNGDTEYPFEDLFARFAKILPATVMAAMVTSMLGYLRETEPEEFELSKFAATCIIGLLIGLFTLELGWSYATAQEYLANSGLTIYIYWTCKIIAKRAGWIGNIEKPAKDPG